MIDFKRLFRGYAIGVTVLATAFCASYGTGWAVLQCVKDETIQTIPPVAIGLLVLTEFAAFSFCAYMVGKKRDG